jgi:hypothetical protein
LNLIESVAIYFFFKKKLVASGCKPLNFKAQIIHNTIYRLLKQLFLLFLLFETSRRVACYIKKKRSPRQTLYKPQLTWLYTQLDETKNEQANKARNKSSKN